MWWVLGEGAWAVGGWGYGRQDGRVHMMACKLYDDRSSLCLQQSFTNSTMGQVLLAA